MSPSWTSTLRKSGVFFKRVVQRIQGTEAMTLAVQHSELQDLIVREEVRRLQSVTALGRASLGCNDLLSADEIFDEAYREMYG